MERPHLGRAGQCSLELALSLLALTALILSLQQLAGDSRRYFAHAWLSREARP